MSKIYLCGIVSAGNEENLRVLIDPIRPYFDGLQWTFHYPTDVGSVYLEAQKGDGRIVYANWCSRHGYSMNHYLYQGTMENGDVFVQIDDSERLSVEFCRDRLPTLAEAMKKENVAMIANYGKGLIYRFNEQLEFKGSPHWYAINLDGPGVNMELPIDQFWNVRNEQRDEYQWIDHYAKYMLYPAGSNHALLGLDHHKGGTPEQIFPVRDKKRLQFRARMRKDGFPVTLEGLTAFVSQPLTDELKGLINSDKVWQDYYAYHVMNDKSVIHSHRPEDGKIVL